MRPSGLPSTLAALLRRPAEATQPFLLGRTSRGEVYAMAAWLRHRLVGREKELLCLATEDKALIAAALLARLAGGPALLLPYALSDQALSAMHQTTGCGLALVDSSRDLPAGMEALLPLAGADGPDLEAIFADPGDVLLHLYTGGSTGMPQVWAKTVANMVGEALFLAGHFAVAEQDRIVATIAPWHIYGLLYAVILPLVTGASVLAAAPSFPEEIVRTLHEQEATILVSVPAHYRALRSKGMQVPSLRLAFSSAGMLDQHDNAAFSRHHPPGIVEVYGSTETGGIGLRNRSVGQAGFVPYPVIDWKLAGQQLLIRSPFLSPGLPLDQASFFTVGDRAEPCGSDGFLLLGRADSITKVAGKRVDLEEIRAVLRAQDGVTDCLVLSLPDAGGRAHRIVALVEGLSVTVETLRARLTDRFEPYALPRTIKMVSRMPVRDNGKYDRAAILRLFQA